MGSPIGGGGQKRKHDDEDRDESRRPHREVQVQLADRVSRSVSAKRRRLDLGGAVARDLKQFKVPLRDSVATQKLAEEKEENEEKYRAEDEKERSIQEEFWDCWRRDRTVQCWESMFKHFRTGSEDYDKDTVIAFGLRSNASNTAILAAVLQYLSDHPGDVEVDERCGDEDNCLSFALKFGEGKGERGIIQWKIAGYMRRGRLARGAKRFVIKHVGPSSVRS